MKPDADGFPPIQDYAFLSDCETCALVAPSGGVEWMCLPRPDSPSVFGAMLDRSAGIFTLAPESVRVPTQRRYLPGSLVLETTWHTPTGWLLVQDCLVMRRFSADEERNPKYRRAPAGFVASGVLLRIATCIDGEIELNLTCLPLFDYGRTAGEWSYPGDGYLEAKVSSDALEEDLRLCASFNLSLAGARAYGRTGLDEGESEFVALSWGERAPADIDDAYEQCLTTAGFWRDWLRDGSFPDDPWRHHLERSAIVLKGLSHAPTGAILAAATTSLPETPGGERNWDYRYTWIRDSSFMLWALFTLGFDWEGYEFFAFLTDTVRSNRVQVMYGIGGECELEESTLDHLSGYGGAQPVRIGNGAYDQRQHDVWGMLLDTIAIHSRREFSRQMAPDQWEFLCGLVEAAAEAWPEPDRGIWEVRGEPRHFTASKVMCWVALDRGAQLAEQRGDGDRAERWRGIAAEIRDEICARGVDERGVFTQHYETDELDASLLLIPLMGFLPYEDDRVCATVLAIADELTENGLVLRYRTETTDDGLAGEEGTFTICSFWLVSAMARIGEIERARKLCERLLGAASPLGLYSEEIDPASGRHLGNFPQAFTHLSLIDAVMGVLRAEGTLAEEPG